MLEHGGNLLLASRLYGISPEDWLDLSTGINPDAYPSVEVPPQAWQRLPQARALEQLAGDYYGCRSLLALAGSQSAIGWLPWLRPESRVAVPPLGYREHEQAWRSAGHQVEACGWPALQTQSTRFDVVVIINPNNPTGECLSAEDLLRLHHDLAARGGWLLVDEAFMDVDPRQSVAGHSHLQGLIVLRSVGKFFGLAGIRLGFMLAHKALLDQMRARAGPWAVSGPAVHVGSAALADQAWQRRMRKQLRDRSHRLDAMLHARGLAPHGGTGLFRWVRTDNAQNIHVRLAKKGILTRLFRQPASLRFGLPGDSEFERLADGLEQVMTGSDHP